MTSARPLHRRFAHLSAALIVALGVVGCGGGSTVEDSVATAPRKALGPTTTVEGTLVEVGPVVVANNQGARPTLISTTSFSQE